MTPEKAAEKFSWVKVGEDGVPEFYCDHSMLSALRQCESYFTLTHLQNYRAVARNWNLEFGVWLHSTLELFYKHEYWKLQQILENPDVPCYQCGIVKRNHLDPTHLWQAWDYIPKGTFIGYGLQLWSDYKMEDFVDKHKYAKMLGGAVGAAALLSDYYDVYGGGQERLRVIGIEMPFGHKKEAPIVDDVFAATYPSFLMYDTYQPKLRAYLTGRFDQLIDDNISISPFDHKSTAFFDGGEATKFNPHDGMEGYAYAADKMIRTLTDNRKRCSSVMVNHICLQQKDKNDKANNTIIRRPQDRFTRTKLSYTPEQFEEFRLRQAATFDVLYQIVILERPAQWNTSVCNNMYHKECPFKNLHDKTPSVREQILRNQYQVVEAWTPFYESRKEIV